MPGRTGQGNHANGKQENRDTRVSRGQEAVSRDPENARLYASLGKAFSDAGQKMEAIRAYQQSLRLKPDQPIVLRELQSLKGR